MFELTITLMLVMYIFGIYVGRNWSEWTRE